MTADAGAQELKALLSGSALESALARLAAAEAEFELCKRRVASERKVLGRLLDR